MMKYLNYTNKKYKTRMQAYVSAMGRHQNSFGGTWFPWTYFCCRQLLP